MSDLISISTFDVTDCSGRHSRSGTNLCLAPSGCPCQICTVGNDLTKSGRHIHRFYHLLFRNIVLFIVSNKYCRKYTTGTCCRCCNDTFHTGIVASHLQCIRHHFCNKITTQRFFCFTVAVHKTAFRSYQPASWYLVRFISIQRIQHGLPHILHLFPGIFYLHIPLLCIL